MKKVKIISEPAPVSMGDDWFEVVDVDHFWIERRYAVFKQLASSFIDGDLKVAEIGSGNGVFQYQFEKSENFGIDGIDLNISYLNVSIAQKGEIICYNILEKREQFKEKYDVILLMDVIEHIENESEFISAVKYMLKKGGFVILNVPAFQTFYSTYDKSVGHIRRYTFKSLSSVLKEEKFKIKKWSYWGLPLVPLLIIRKGYLTFVDKSKIVREGMEVPNKFMNLVLKIFSKIEFIPNKFLGSSLLIIAKYD